MRKTLLLDCDDVLCDFVGGVLRAVNVARGTSFRPEECHERDIARSFGLTWEYIGDIVKRRFFCAELAELPGARNAVERLRALCDVYIVTAPWPSKRWMRERTDWLMSLGFDSDHIIFCRTKKLVWGDILIDDRTQTIIEWAEKWPAGTALLWNKPYNQGALLPSNAHRVLGWSDVFEVFARMGERGHE